MKRLTYILTLLTCLCLHLSGAAQAASYEAPKYVFKNWNNRNGLPQNTVFDLATDANGYLWIATNEGLCRFDGDRFELFSKENTEGLYSSTFCSLVAGKDQTLWAASWNSILSISKNEIKALDLRKEATGSWISQIAEDKQGRLWIGTITGRLFVLENNQVKKAGGWNLEEQVSVQAMVPFNNGVLVGTEKGLYEVSGVAAKAYRVAGLEKTDVRALANGNGQSVWIGTKESGLYHYSTGSIRQYTEKNGLKEDYISQLSLAPDSSLWIGTSSSGLQILKNGAFHSVAGNGYALDGLKTVFFSAPNLVWLGTPASGLIQMKPAAVQMVYDKKLSGQIILPIYQHPNGDVWVGTAGQGINRIRNGKVSVINSRQGLANEIVLSVYGTATAVYIGTPRGLNRYNLATDKIDRLYNSSNGLASSLIQSILQTSDQKLWIATRAGGLHQLTGDKFTRVALPAPMANAELTGMYEDREKNLWVGSTGAGIACLHPNGGTSYYQPELAESGNIVYDFYEDRRSVIWMASEEGLIRFANNKFTLLNKANGLQFNGAYRLIDDGVGHLWLSGNFGLQRLLLRELENIDPEKNSKPYLSSRLFDHFEGMNNAEANGNVFPAGWRMKDNSIWFPTTDGIARLVPGNIAALEEGLNIKIETIGFNNKTLPAVVAATIPPNVPLLAINYTSVDFTQPHSIKYYYRLKGLSDAWENAGNRKTAYFTSLKHGRYRFELRSEQYGRFSPVASLDFRIRPFYYQTLGFKALALALLFGFGILVQKFYDHTRREKMLEGMVAERTVALNESNLRYQDVNTELNRSREAYQSLFSHNPYAVFSVDLHGQFTRANPVMSELSGYTLPRLLRMSFLDMIPKDDRTLVRTNFSLPGTQEAHSYKATVITAKKHLLKVDITYLPIVIEGKVTGMYGIIKDITQQVKAEEEIKLLNAGLEEKIKERTGQVETVNKELEAFSYSVSHDLRAPLRAINSYAQLLYEDHQQNLDEDGKTIVINIRNNAHRMGLLIDELLAFSRLGRKELNKSDVDLNELAQEVVRNIIIEQHTEAEIKIGKLPHVQADYNLMYQALHNLVSNAVKYSSKKEKPLVEIYDNAKNGKDVIVVQDNGVGFDMRYADRLFGVFQRLHSEKDFDGTGVGLAIVKRILSKHGGEIWAEAKENEGAKFYFTVN